MDYWMKIDDGGLNIFTLAIQCPIIILHMRNSIVYI